MTPAPAPSRWGLREAGFGFVAATALSALAAQAAAAAVGFQLGHGHPVPLAVTAAGLVGLWAGLVGAAVYASRAEGSGRLGADYGLSISWPRDVVIGALAGLGTQIVLIPLLYLPFELSDPTLRHRLESPARADTAAVSGHWQIAVLFVLLAAASPVVEELFFRGLVQRSLARRFGPAVAIAGSAAIFGLAHFEALQLPALFLFGLVLGLLAQRTGRLGAGMAAHVVFNAFTVLTLTVAK